METQGPQARNKGWNGALCVESHRQSPVRYVRNYNTECSFARLTPTWQGMDTYIKTGTANWKQWGCTGEHVYVRVVDACICICICMFVYVRFV